MRRFLVVVFAILLGVNSAYAAQVLEFSRVRGSHAGVNFHVLKAAYAKLGVEIEAHVLPSKRALVKANSGEMDGEVTRIESIEALAPNLIRIPVPIIEIQIGAVSYDPELVVSGWESLRDQRIGIKRGAVYAEVGCGHFEKVHRLPDREVMYKLILGRDIDVLIDSKLNFLKWQAANEIRQLYWHDSILCTQPLFHFLHKKHADLVPKITKVLLEMKESGETERIINDAIEDLLKKP